MNNPYQAIGLAVLLLISSFAALAAETTAVTPVVPSNEMNATAHKRLLTMAQFIASQPQLSVTWHSGYDVVQPTGQKLEFAETRTLTLLRPERLRVDVQRDDGRESRVLFDGQRLTVIDKTLNVYATTDFTGSVDAVIKHLVKEMGLRLPLALLFVTTLPDELEQRLHRVESVGTSNRHGVMLEHLALRTDSVDVQVWLPTTRPSLRFRVVLPYSQDEGQPQYWAEFTDWHLSPPPSTDVFATTPPAGFTRIDFLADVPPPASNTEATGATP